MDKVIHVHLYLLEKENNNYVSPSLPGVDIENYEMGL